MNEGGDGGDVAALVRVLAGALLERELRFVTAESCTGGGIAAACSDLDGASEWFWGGLVTYTLDAKRRLLGVPQRLLDHHGAVSGPVARAMAEGALATSGAELAVSVTGIAGPGGGEVLQPVGTVWFGWALRGVRTETGTFLLEGDRAAVRAAATAQALRGAIAMLAAAPGDD
ncbi:MAG: nicotinamide-nucleotide amidohydrolase family protein [Pseudomonadales bacterium]|nr:nicotinamide-nucleotide amidohydrolase family protein [Pseudomonadales bacterium]